MKKIFVYFLATGSLLATSCDDSLDVIPPQDFNVTTEKTTYTVGEEITFQLSGNPNIITFYSGEVGSDYAYSEGRIASAGDVTLSFDNRVLYGTQPDQLSILVSSDYSGARNIDAITAANWTDITDRFTLATGDAYVPAGTANLTDLVVEEKPLYLAFRYIFDPEKGGGRTWYINNLALTSTTPLGATVLANHTNADFQLFYVGPKDTDRSSIVSGYIAVRSNAEPNNTDYTEDWCVSMGFDLGEKEMGPDRPIKVKGNSDAVTDAFNYAYTEPGTYKAYFVATNATIKEQESIIKEITLEITP